MTVCVFKGAKKNQKFEENFCTFLGLSFLPHFFSFQTGVCFCVVKNTRTLNTKAKECFVVALLR